MFNYQSIHAAASEGCECCALMKAIVDDRCACDLNDAHSKQGTTPRSRHDCTSFALTDLSVFDHNPPTMLTASWTCGHAKIDFRKAAGWSTQPSPMSQLLAPAGNAIDHDPLSEVCVATISTWLTRCRGEHLVCNAGITTQRPKRLLSIRDGQEVRLEDTENPHGPLVPYAALSYCWGGARPLSTVRESVEDNHENIPWPVLPRTYQDAIIVLRQLGICYVWIDSLCIIQDDVQDRESEIARMGSIYANAELVMVAADASTPYDGFLGLRTGQTWSDVECEKDPAPSFGKVRVRKHITHNIDITAQTPISTRAWTFQERLLARRCLIFKQDELAWECREGCECECGVSSPMPTGDARPESQLLRWAEVDESAERGVLWRAFVSLYSGRKLSVATDRLPAISALAKAMESSDDAYTCGLWKSDLICQLMWRVDAVEDLNEKPLVKFGEYIAPTWSWASHADRTHYEYCEAPGHGKYTAEVKTTASHSASINPYGAVTSGHIVLHGIHSPAIISVPASRIQREILKAHLKSGYRLRMGSHWSSRSSLDALPVTNQDIVLKSGETVSSLQRATTTDNIEHQGECSGEVLLFWLTDKCILILAYSMRERGAFERLGILFCDNESSIPKQLRETERKDVKII